MWTWYLIALNGDKGFMEQSPTCFGIRASSSLLFKDLKVVDLASAVPEDDSLDSHFGFSAYQILFA